MICRIEDGYVCGQVLDAPFYYVKEVHHCYGPIEPHYYATGDTEGGRVLRKNICARCHGTESIMSTYELQKLRDTNGKELLPMCRYCFGVDIPLMFSPKLRVNQTKNSAKARDRKRKRMEQDISSGCRAHRK